MRFIEAHADRRSADGLRWGVEPICAVLAGHGVKIAPSTYYAHRTRALSRGRCAMRRCCPRSGGCTRPRRSAGAYETGYYRQNSARQQPLRENSLSTDPGALHVLDADTGQLLRELTLDPTRDYQPTGRPPDPPKKTA